MLHIALSRNSSPFLYGHKSYSYRGFCDTSEMDKRVNQLIDAKLSSQSNQLPHTPYPPSPPTSQSRFNSFRGFVMKRPFLLLGLGILTSSYVYWKYFPHHAKKMLGKNESGVQENLIIKREIDDIRSYRYSVIKAVEGDLSSEMYAKSMSTSLQHSLAKLDLSSEQHKMLSQLGTAYDVKNKEVVSQLLNVVQNGQVLDAIRKTPNGKDNSTEHKSSFMDETVRLISMKVSLDMGYLRSVSNILTDSQYMAWSKEVGTHRHSLMTWMEMLSVRPVVVTQPDRPKVFVLTFDGDMMASQVKKFRKEVTAVVSAADPERGDSVVVLVNSGGGTVNGYGLAAAQLERIKAKGLGLTVCVDEVAASGGYLMACVADHIVASPFAMLGSIGVISTMPNFYERLKREGVEVEDVTAGQYKRTLTPYKKITSADKYKMQKDVEDIHGLFKGFVHKHRPHLNISAVSTGEVWLGSMAIEKGLCDELGTSDDFLLKCVQEGREVYRVRLGVKASGLKGLLQELDERRGRDEDASGGLLGLIGALRAVAAAIDTASRLFRDSSVHDQSVYFEPQMYSGKLDHTRFE